METGHIFCEFRVFRNLTTVVTIDAIILVIVMAVDILALTMAMFAAGVVVVVVVVVVVIFAISVVVDAVQSFNYPTSTPLYHRNILL